MALHELPHHSVEEERPCSGQCDQALRSRILIIDDEPLFGQTMTLLLGPEHDVTVERNGRDALQRLLGGAQFDLVLCDVSLPDIAGPSLYERVAAHDPALARRFVFVTGGAFTQAAREFLGSYEGKRLDKPFTMSDLERVLYEQRRLSA